MDGNRDTNLQLMPALSGQVITMLTNDAGAPAIVVSWFFNPATGDLRDAPSPWTSPTGKVWTGKCLIADNMTSRAIAMTITNPATGTTRTLSIPANDRSLTAAQLAALPPPNGPFTKSTDLNGLSFDLS